eukprot:1118266-Prymnesium_polylepis.1
MGSRSPRLPYMSYGVSYSSRDARRKPAAQAARAAEGGELAAYCAAPGGDTHRVPPHLLPLGRLGGRDVRRQLARFLLCSLGIWPNVQSPSPHSRAARRALADRLPADSHQAARRRVPDVPDCADDVRGPLRQNQQRAMAGAAQALARRCRRCAAAAGVHPTTAYVLPGWRLSGRKPDLQHARLVCERARGAVAARGAVLHARRSLCTARLARPRRRGAKLRAVGVSVALGQ